MAQQQVIIDDKGSFYTNVGQFPFVDPSTGVRFEPGVQIKVNPTAWMKGQSVIQLVDKPTKSDK